MAKRVINSFNNEIEGSIKSFEEFLRKKEHILEEEMRLLADFLKFPATPFTTTHTNDNVLDLGTTNTNGNVLNHETRNTNDHVPDLSTTNTNTNDNVPDINDCTDVLDNFTANINDNMPDHMSYKTSLAHRELGSLINRVVLEEKNHKYRYNDNTTSLLSASGCVGILFSPFPKKAIAKAIVSSSKFLCGKYGHYADCTDPVKKIIDEWQQKAIESAMQGTKLHKAIQTYYENIYGCNSNEGILREHWNNKCFQQFLDFDDWRRKQGQLEPYFAELAVGDLEYKLCGSIDMLFIDRNTGHLVIVDWKYSNSDFYRDYKRKGKGPMSDKLDTKFNRYSLQLNIYKYILEKPLNEYGKIVDGMYLVQFSDDTSTYQLHAIATYTPDFMEQCIIYCMENI